jgi:hypothetical protein
MIIDNFSQQNLRSNLGTYWRAVSDEVMGGISKANIVSDVFDSRICMRLSGHVCLDNNGGFIQAALNLDSSGKVFDASDYTGIRLVVRGNEEQYSVHIRTPDNKRSWQSYRSHFFSSMDWSVIKLPFSDFSPHRLSDPLDISRLRRIGIVAIGKAFYADMAVCEISLYR